jgi:hypothetical protein
VTEAARTTQQWRGLTAVHGCNCRRSLRAPTVQLAHDCASCFSLLVCRHGCSQLPTPLDSKPNSFSLHRLISRHISPPPFLSFLFLVHSSSCRRRCCAAVRLVGARHAPATRAALASPTRSSRSLPRLGVDHGSRPTNSRMRERSRRTTRRWRRQQWRPRQKQTATTIMTRDVQESEWAKTAAHVPEQTHRDCCRGVSRKLSFGRDG